MFIGPLTDKYGRKKILVGSMLLFAIASVLCIFSPDIFVFNAMRVLQGVAGAGGIVISKGLPTAGIAIGSSVEEVNVLLSYSISGRMKPQN